MPLVMLILKGCSPAIAGKARKTKNKGKLGQLLFSQNKHKNVIALTLSNHSYQSVDLIKETY